MASDEYEYYDDEGGSGFPLIGGIAFIAILAVFSLLVLSLNRQQDRINEQNSLIDQALDGSGSSIVYYPTGVFRVDTNADGERAVNRNAVQISGRTCFRGIGPFETASTERWRFGPSGPPAGFASIYEAADQRIGYGGPNDRPQLNENDCNVFTGFGQKIPDALRQDMDEAPCEPLTMYVSFTVAGTDLGTGSFTPPVPVQTDLFTIPPADDC